MKDLTSLLTILLVNLEVILKNVGMPIKELNKIINISNFAASKKTLIIINRN